MTLQYVFLYSLVAQQVEFDQLTGVCKYNRPPIKEVMCSQLEPTDITKSIWANPCSASHFLTSTCQFVDNNR